MTSRFWLSSMASLLQQHLPHAARVAGRVVSYSTIPAVGSTSPSLGTSISFISRASRTTPLSRRHCSSHTKPASTLTQTSGLSYRFPFKMGEPTNAKEVRKYLQQTHDRIFENNKKWAEEMRKKKPEFFSDLAAGQAPEYLWIGEFAFFVSVHRSILSQVGHYEVGHCSSKGARLAPRKQHTYTQP